MNHSYIFFHHLESRASHSPVLCTGLDSNLRFVYFRNIEGLMEGEGVVKGGGSSVDRACNSCQEVKGSILKLVAHSLLVGLLSVSV